MEIGLWVLCGVLVFIVIFLVGKVHLMRKSAQEIQGSLDEIITSDTNILISISSRDRQIQQLANSLNTQLSTLRRERHRYQQGDAELKEAITNISHDLRTPLTAICGYLDLLEVENKSESIQRYLDRIQNRTEVLKQLTEELFRYSIITSVQEISCEDLTLNRALEEILVSYYGAFKGRHIEPEIEIPDVPIHRALDFTALSRILGNILSNVIKYSDGDLAVRLHGDGKITFTNSTKDLTLVMVGRLFDRFYTIEDGRSSTGLGLSIAKILTERMGGHIDADYQDGKLTVELYFPEKNE